jgi:hypothetical protein
MNRGLLLATIVLASGLAWANQDSPRASATQSGGEVLRKAQQSAVLVLTGDGVGTLHSVTAGIVTRSDGIVLTAYRPLKDSQEVQVRFADGEVYDEVELVGYDERRDVAALHIPATGLTALPAGQATEMTPGEKVYVLAPNGGMVWMTSEGVVGPVRLADELSGAGKGFRVVQFMAQLPGGTLGGVLLNARGEMLGILPGTLFTGGPQYAIPFDSVAGLAAQGMRTRLGTGKNLELPTTALSASAPPPPDSSPTAVLARARTLRVNSRTSFFTPFMLEKELLDNPGFRGIGMNVLRDSTRSDLIVEVDRPLFTYDFTYSVADSRSGTILASGKVTAIDGSNAAKGIAKKIVQELEKARALDAAQLNHL